MVVWLHAEVSNSAEAYKHHSSVFGSPAINAQIDDMVNVIKKAGTRVASSGSKSAEHPLFQIFLSESHSYVPLKLSPWGKYNKRNENKYSLFRSGFRKR